MLSLLSSKQFFLRLLQDSMTLQLAYKTTPKHTVLIVFFVSFISPRISLNQITRCRTEKCSNHKTVFSTNDKYQKTATENIACTMLKSKNFIPKSRIGSTVKIFSKTNLKITILIKNNITDIANPGVGYTMRDIRYFWKDGLSSVGMSSEVELPQFRVLGHRQRATEINLTTGTPSLAIFEKKTTPNTPLSTIIFVSVSFCLFSHHKTVTVFYFLSHVVF